MAYHLFLGSMLYPVTPSKIDVKIKGQNKTLTLINDTVVNVLKNPGLTEISFDLLLPNVPYRFATYDIKYGFRDASFYLAHMEWLKTSKKPFRFLLTRYMPSGRYLFDTNMSVSLENYTIKEDAKQGLDVIVSVTLKQYVEYGTKIVKVLTSDGTASIEKTRETENSPAPSENSVKTHTVTGDDTLWNIAKMYYGDGSKYTLIYEANKDKIANPSVIREGQVLTIPGVSGNVITSGVSANVNQKQKYTLTINTLFDALEGYIVKAIYEENNKFVEKILIENTIDGDVEGLFKRTSTLTLEKGALVTFYFQSNSRISFVLVGDNSWHMSSDGEPVFETIVDKNKEVTVTSPSFRDLTYWY